ncbi:Mitochondrial distribution and morphology protein 10 [Escovopsis weberi]|uniref:Mitochondrial distribution and morphology protein 10 n=1 Tax=Escovopsis weberi TaxID=150374 RepID=A0A0M9VRS6_ESCWE|nr:Mitochondrial distribution and morphology protein 10 [Escovopsis weberi]
MREFMDYVHSAFYEATGWRRDNTYAALNSTADALLNFDTPLGLRLTLSSLASSNFATSYQLGSVGVVDGSISYLFSSVPLRVLLTPQTEKVPLPVLLRSFQSLGPLTRRDGGAAPALAEPEHAHGHGHEGKLGSIDRPHESLLYGRLYLPQSQLEALLVRRLSPAFQVQFSAVSGQHLRNGGTALGLVQFDVGRYALEGLASSDGGLLGFRGVYNFGGDMDSSPVPSSSLSSSPLSSSSPSVADHAGGGGGGGGGGNGNGNGGDKERIYGRFSTGGEIYYGTLNKSGGVSIGTRFATLPEHRGTPLSATLTLNPLMGNIAASYAVRAGKHCSLATRMEFNVFSYESQWAMGMELWRKPFARANTAAAAAAAAAAPALPDDALTTDVVPLAQDTMQAAYTTSPPSTPTSMEVPLTISGRPRERSFQAKLDWRLDDPQELMARTEEEEDKDVEKYAGVLKARLDQNLRIGVLWEGRVKSLLFSLGSGIDLRRMDKPFRTLGLEIQFSS